jgi:DNA invertase Pin-like site-specific DNA recombinase
MLARVTPFRKPTSYARISLDRLSLEEGVTRQNEDTEALRQRHGLPPFVRRFVDNDKSATRGGPRPEYAELLEYVKAGQTDCVAVYMLSRLWRNRTERAIGVEIFRQHGVSVLCAKGPQLDMTQAAGRLLAGLLGEVDTFETEQLAEREQRKMRQQVEKGVPVRTGQRRYGYEVDGETIVLDEAVDIRRMHRALHAGDSLSGIARDLNERSRLNRNGRPWDHNAVRYLLLNPYYASLREYPARRKKSDPPGELYRGTWPAIVDEEAWRTSKFILEDESRVTSGGSTGRVWLGSGIYLCGIHNDGTTMTSGSRGPSNGKPGPNQPIYRCRSIKHLARYADPIDALVELRVLDRLSRPDAADLLVDHEAPEVEDLHAKATALRGRLDSLAKEFAEDDAADLREFREATRRIRERLAVVESKMAHPKRARVLVDLILAEDPADHWQTMPLERKRAVISTLFEVTVLKGQAGNRPFDPETVRIEPAQGMA